MNDLVSIVVPIYNMEKKLTRCLKSIEEQTYVNIEVLLINDGSTDSSSIICDDFVNRDSRFKYFEKENGGLSSARNYGISLSKGKFIYFIDSDDYCELDIIKKLIGNIEDDIQISSCGYVIEYPFENISLEKKYQASKKYHIKEFLLELESNDMLNVVWNKLYRLDVIKNNRLFFEEDMMPGEDLIFNCKYLSYVENGLTISENLYHYMRENEETLVNKYDPKLLAKITTFINEKKNLLHKMNLNTETYESIIAKTTIQYAFSCLTNTFRKSNNDKSHDKIAVIKEIINICRENNWYLKYNTQDRNLNLYMKLIKLNSPVFIYLVYSTLFFLRNHFSKLYLRYRGRTMDGERGKAKYEKC